MGILSEKFRLVFAVASTSREVVLSESQANFASAQSASHCYFLPAEMQHVSTKICQIRSGAKKMSRTFARIFTLPDMIAQVLKALRVPEIISINLLCSRPM